jgi:ParB-like chromosome segregation protein Spo0J
MAEDQKPPRAKRGPKRIGIDATIDDLHQDPTNRRVRTARGSAMIAESIHKVGLGRSVLVNRNNQIIAGNGVVAGAKEAGISKVRIVDAARDEVIAVRRSDLTPEQERLAAMYDNRTSELAAWNGDQLQADHAKGLELAPFFTETELRRHLKAGHEEEPVVEEVQTAEVSDKFWISVRGPLKHQAHALLRLRELLGALEGVSVEIGTISKDEMVAL